MSENGNNSSSIPRKRPTSRLFEREGVKQQTANTNEGSSPVLEVPGSPSPGRPATGDSNKQKKPTSIYRHNRLFGNGSDSERVAPRSEIASKNNDNDDPFTSKFFNKHSNGTNSSPGRLLSLDRFSYKSPSDKNNSASSGSTVFSRYAKLLNKDNSENGSNGNSNSRPQIGPSATISSEQKKLVQQLSSVFKDISEDTIVSAVKLHKTFDPAANWLARHQQRQKQQQEQQPPAKKQKSIQQSFFAPAKRQMDKPAKKIREKFGTSSKTADDDDDILDDDEDEDDGTIIKRRNTPTSFSEAGADDQPKGRLVKAKNMQREAEIMYSDESDEEHYESEGEVEFDNRLLEFLNTASLEDIADIAACKEELAQVIIDARPFETVDDAREVDLQDPNRKPSKRRKPAGEKLVNDCSTTLRGYEAVDSLIRKCDEFGKQVSDGVKKWGVDVLGTGSELSLAEVNGKATEGNNENDEDDDIKINKRGSYFTDKPKILAEDVELKSYQQVGINWLSLLYNSGLSCILADEMGLGKTCQVIAFLAHLQEVDRPGPHLVVVPSSTLENWLREFQRFCPSLKIEPYYGSQAEREELRAHLTNPETEFDVMVTTYNLACGSKPDFGFLKSMNFNVCVYDEGHLLKNNQSERYSKLMRLKANFRLLLTGTPLQNNLRELVSLLSFILPNMFQERKDELGAIFKHKAKATDDNNSTNRNPLLSEQRITKAKSMMTPFILRRRKEHVLSHLPPKSHNVEYCELTDFQREIYDHELETSRKNIEIRELGGRAPMTNVLMQLRKAAIHPLLFRKQYTDGVLRTMAKEIMAEPVYKDANEQYIYEDMEVMSDFELHGLCEKFSSTIGHHMLPDEEWQKSGKVQKLAEILPQLKERGDRALLFSQFTQMLDILERVLTNLDIAFLRLDGQTPVEVRQDMIDKFASETDITVFLLSTKAGGFGINLAAANTVLIHDLSFNPHDDKQAEDRAHRVGQTQEVKVSRLIARDTIEENILALANTKLALDASVSDEKEAEKEEQNNAKMVAKMMFGSSAVSTENNSGTSTPFKDSSVASTPAPKDDNNNSNETL